MGPHQVRLRGLPLSSALPGYDAKLLIDIHPQKYPGTDEEPQLIFPVLSILESSAFELTTMTFKDDVGDEVLKALEQARPRSAEFQCQDRCCDRPSATR